MPSSSAITKPAQMSVLLFLSSLLLEQSGITDAASLRDHRLRGAESHAPNQDMVKALQYIQNLHQNAKSQDQPNPEFERSVNNEQRNKELQLEDKSEELLQAVLSTLKQTKNAGSLKNADNAKAQAITPHEEMPLMFEDNEKVEESEDGSDLDWHFKRTNENVEEKYTPQNLATLQSIFDELGKVNFNLNSKRENSNEEGERLFNAREADYDDWDQDEREEEEEETRREFERALDYLENTEQETKRSEDEGEMANIADFYLLKVLEQTEEEEQKKRETEEEEEERIERSTSNIDPKMIYKLLQISQKYQIPPEDLFHMLRTGEIAKLKFAPIYTKNTFKKPVYFNNRQKSAEELRKERIFKILGLKTDENSAQNPFRKQFAKTKYARPIWRQKMIPKQPMYSTKLKDDYDDTENDLATFLAARMLSKYPTYKAKMNQKREETEEEQEGGSFERAIRDYFDQLDSDRNEDSLSDLEQRGVDDLNNEEIIKLLSFVSPDEEQDAKPTE